VYAALVAGLSTVGFAQTPADQFRYERPIVTAGAGPRRLSVDATLLAGGGRFQVSTRGETPVAERGLQDLRLVDDSGKAVPYLLMYPPATARAWMTGRLLDVAPTKKTSGFEVDLGELASVDSLSLMGIPPPYLKRVMLEGSGDREHWTSLVAEGTLFHLPDEQLGRETLAFTAGPYRYLRVTWDDTNSARVPTPRTAQARRVSIVSTRTPVAVEAAFERRPSEPGMSRYRVRLPAAGLPIVALDLSVAGGAIHRFATVAESRFASEEAAPVTLGTMRLLRVTRDGTTADALRIAITPPSEAELQLTIIDNENPPLDLQQISIVLAELPTIYFEAPAGGVRARYGSRTATRPQYDLEALRDTIDLSKVSEATWGPQAALPESTTPSPAPLMPEAGAQLDAAIFKTSRSIDAPAPGLAALPLDAHALARSRGPGARFADVRILDDGNRQVPYLVERQDEPISIDLPVAPAPPSQAPALKERAGRRPSLYRITLPYPNMPPGTLVVETSARVFERTFRLGVERAPDRTRRDPAFDVRASEVWRHTNPETPARPLSLRLGSIQETEYLLAVDEGDNAALPITKIRLLLPSYRLRFYRTGSVPLRLVYGRDDLQPARYDLALLAPQVMGAVATEVAAVPDRGELVNSAPPGARQTVSAIFWVAMSLSVLILLAIIARLLTQRGADL